MTLLRVPTDDQTLGVLRELAAREHLSPEELVARLLKNYTEQHQFSQSEEQWAAIGLFASNQTDTSRRAEEILEKEWNPD